MKKTKLFHNPGAGDGDITKKELLSMIRNAGFECSYSSTKKSGWEKIESKDLDFIVLAGGDGTVRKVAEELLDRKILDKSLPIGLLPLGTANNIATTLGITGNASQLIYGWGPAKKKFDVGRIYGLKKSTFFLEALGYGIFPRLMKEMKKQDTEIVQEPKVKIATALELLYELILSTEATRCAMTIDGVPSSGKFLLVEVMNTKSVGPNLNLAPFADPGDGELDIVLISDAQRDEFASYVRNKINGKEQPSFFNTIKAKTLTICSEEKHMHVDDAYMTSDGNEEITIELKVGLLEFLLVRNDQNPIYETTSN